MKETKQSPCGMKCWSWENKKDACDSCIQRPLTKVKTLLCNIGWYPTIEEARLKAKEMKRNGKKYRIKRMANDCGCILYEVVKIKETE